MNPRRRAREAVLKVLYQCEALGDGSGSGAAQFWEHFPEPQEIRLYANQLIQGVLLNRPLVDQWIERSTDNWSLDRLSMVDRNILRMAIYEMLFVEEVPVKVSINEAMEIAKLYSGEQSCGFINGILDRVMKDSISQGSEGTLAAGA